MSTGPCPKFNVGKIPHIWQQSKLFFVNRAFAPKSMAGDAFGAPQHAAVNVGSIFVRLPSRPSWTDTSALKGMG